jgi:aminoglycoside phosphotransferase (APT) family kinase protein
MHFAKKEPDSSSGEAILRLSGSRILKTHCANTEYQALKLIDRHTSVPTYKVLAVYNRPEGKVVEYEAHQGKSLEHVWPGMSAHQKNKIIADLGRFVDQLRKMKPPKQCVVGDATLGAAMDHRFGSGRIGPFFSIEAFQEFERRGHSPYHFPEKEIHTVHAPKKPYELKFTHANLCPKNILVDESGRICALVGWESSGWYPEYWEYTQMCHLTPKTMGDWLDAVCNVIPRYDQELASEEALRARYCGSVYDLPRSVRAPSPTPSQLNAERQEIVDKNTSSTSG